MSNLTIDATSRTLRPRTISVSPVKRLANWITREFRVRRDIDALAELDDRMLADIGISRGEIWYAARYGRTPSCRKV